MHSGWRLGVATVACVVLAGAMAPRAHAGNPTECEKKAAQRVSHDCVSCDASVLCLERVTAAGGAAEIIPIGHGLMVIYSTPMTRRVGEVQNAALERWDVMDKIIAGRAEGHLCASCCAARTLLMRADRQVYRTSTGVVAMITSDDFSIVTELHRMVPKRRVVTPEP
ncbi:MAG: hypothetical protein ABI960_00345 [Candidatus Eisenbacteria bacterium]